MLSKIDNNTVALILIGAIAIIGAVTNQAELATAGVGALAGYVAKGAADILDNRNQ